MEGINNKKVKFLIRDYESNLDKTVKIIAKKAIGLIAYNSHITPIINSLLKNNYKGQIITINKVFYNF